MGHCICRDGLTPALDAICEADWPWTMFDPEHKQLRHETVFPEHCKNGAVSALICFCGEGSPTAMR